jgi:hypothetical protein
VSQVPKPLTCLLLVALFVALAAPSAAAEVAAGCHPHLEATTYEIGLHGTDGYALRIESDARERVTLGVETRHEFARYTVPGASKLHRLRARFGRLGYIALHIRRPRRDPFPAEPVVLEGRIVFRGEDGFTSISRRRVRGAVFHSSVKRCEGGAPESRALASRSDAHTRVTQVAAVEKGSNRSVAVSVQASDPPNLEEEGGGDFVFALLQETRGRMNIVRGVYGTAIAGVGNPVGTDPLAGSVSPPLPFRGTASYSRASASPTVWSGDLSVSFPGARNVPLVGPGFSALACSATAFRAVDSCREEVNKLIESSLLLGPIF